jgi:hypothetical protein
MALVFFSNFKGFPCENIFFEKALASLRTTAICSETAMFFRENFMFAEKQHSLFGKILYLSENNSFSRKTCAF